MKTTKITRKLNEYRVRLYDNGVYQPEADYFTSDLYDAQVTAAVMVEGSLVDSDIPVDEDPLTFQEVKRRVQALGFKVVKATGMDSDGYGYFHVIGAGFMSDYLWTAPELISRYKRGTFKS